MPFVHDDGPGASRSPAFRLVKAARKSDHRAMAFIPEKLFVNGKLFSFHLCAVQALSKAKCAFHIFG
jgi:hypothetical protein